MLLVSKFIPGFASVATALAGDTRTRLSRFLLFDAGGAVLWAGAALLLGSVFHLAIGDVLATLEQLGRIGISALAILLALFIALKWWQRRRFLQEIRMARIQERAAAGGRTRCVDGGRSAAGAVLSRA